LRFTIGRQLTEGSVADPEISGHFFMKGLFTMRYRPTTDGTMFIGTIMEVEGVGSQGKTVEELEKNLLNALRAMFADSALFAARGWKRIEIAPNVTWKEKQLPWHK